MSKRKLQAVLKKSLLLLCMLTSIYVSAQSTTVTGKVVGPKGEELLGVNVYEKGGSTGTTTDIEGNYSVVVSSPNAILVYSYIGYTTLELSVDGKSSMNVTLKEDLSFLDEVVVIGYGTTKKSDITGSVSSVTSEELNAFPVLDAAQALQGRAAGVVVQSNNGGEPGTPVNVKIRGNTSLGASSSPLVVVDGFVNGVYPQQADIESIEILKDASATAIYGSQGANGVIIVTTKKGRLGKVSVELNSTYSFQQVANQLDLLNADQYGAYQRDINPNFVQGPANTDWQDLIYRGGSTQNHNLAFSGAAENVNYYVSANYFNQDGVVISSGFERFSALGKVDVDVTDKLRVGANLFGSRSTKNGVSTQADTGGRGSGDVISLAYRFGPDLGIFDANGDFTFSNVGDDVDNPFAVATESVDETVVDQSRTNFYGEYDIYEDLSVKSVFGYSTRNERRGTFSPSTLQTTAGAAGGRAAVENADRTSLLTETYLTYNKEIDVHSITAVAGYSFQRTNTIRNSAGAEGLTSDSFSFYNLGGGAVQLIPQSSFSETVIESQFGRLNYGYDDRYLLTFTGRRDGSSNFARNNKYAFFPSAAIGWNISKESFMEDVQSINNLKLRASYGATGTQSISPYQSLASLRTYYSVTGGQTVNAVIPNTIANPNLKWETSYQTNLGLDLGLLNNGIVVSMDYYNINTEDLILGDASVPEIAGYFRNQNLKNVGEMNNKGFEITLTTRNLRTDDFSWTTDFNYSTNKNKIVSLVDGNDIFLDASPGHFLQDQTHVLRVGEPVGVFYGWEYRGVNPGTAPEGTASFRNDSTAGGELFTDVNGDGVINNDDRVVIGNPNAKWSAGLTNTFIYKDFDLSIFFQGVFGNDIANLTAVELASGGSNATTAALDRYTPTNTDTNVPIANQVRSKRLTSRFVEDGSYVRLKNLSIGYNLPESILEKLGFERIRVGVSGQNLLTFTDYSGTDPEVSYRSTGDQNNVSNSNVNQGFDYGNYPSLRSVSFNLNFKF